MARPRVQLPKGFADLRNAPQLQSFVLPNVRQTGRRIGGGSYGTVEELEVEGLFCAGKKLHEILLEQDEEGTQSVLRKFVEECSLLANLRHPHVVQFMGICFQHGSDLPMLVMEYLPYCLDSLLEGANRVDDIPLAIKCSILRDVILGLVHLHGRVPPIIHRDLTAKNILLTAAMTGKVADLGVARILNQKPGRLSMTMTQTPGTLAYMPPEVLAENPKYNAAIDMFSFGHLALFTVVQSFPYPTQATMMDPNNPGMILGRSEVQRRSRHMEQLSRQLGGETHPLVQLVRQCLHNDPRQRPSARQVLSQLEGMKSRIEDPYESMSKLNLIQAMRKRKGGEGAGSALQAQVTQLQGQLQASEAQSQQMQSQLRAREIELEAARAEIQQLQGQLQASQAEAQQYRSRLEQLQAHKLPRPFNWRRGRDAQFGISFPYAVLLNGEVYVSGQADDIDDKFVIQIYTPENDKWRRMPTDCPVRLCALVVLNNQLVLVGGTNKDGAKVSTLLVWDSISNSWTTPYPRLPTAKSGLAAVTHQQFLIVAGGIKSVYLNSVEVLNTTTKHWLTAPALPKPCVDLTSVVIGDRLHLLGGDTRGQPNKQMFTVSISALVNYTTGAPALDWEVLDTELGRSCAVSLNNFLFAVGGEGDQHTGYSTISIYDPQTRKWSKFGNLPTVVSACACIILPSGKLAVFGGWGKSTRTKIVYIQK